MGNSKGIKELKEVLIGVIALSTALAGNLKDGIQAADAVAIFEKLQTDETLKEKLVAAYHDVELVPAEVKEISIAELLELVTACVPEVIKLVEALSA